MQLGAWDCRKSLDASGFYKPSKGVGLYPIMWLNELQVAAAEPRR